jgi:hypothetical protein
VEQVDKAAQPVVQQVERAAEPVVQRAEKAAEPVKKAAEPAKAVAEQAVTTVKTAVPPVVAPPPPDLPDPELPAPPELPVVQPIVEDLVGSAEDLPIPQVLPLPPVVPALPQPPALPEPPALPLLPAVPAVPTAPETPVAEQPELLAERPTSESMTSHGVLTAEAVATADSLETAASVSSEPRPGEKVVERAAAAGLVPSVATSSSSLAQLIGETHEAGAETPDVVLAASAILDWEAIAPSPAYAHDAAPSRLAEILPATGVTAPALDNFAATAPHRMVELRASRPAEEPSTPQAPLPSTPAAVATSGNLVPSPGTTSVTALPPRLHVRLDTAWRTLSYEPLLRPPELVLGNLAPPG